MQCLEMTKSRRGSVDKPGVKSSYSDAVDWSSVAMAFSAYRTARRCHSRGTYYHVTTAKNHIDTAISGTVGETFDGRVGGRSELTHSTTVRHTDTHTDIHSTTVRHTNTQTHTHRQITHRQIGMWQTQIRHFNFKCSQQVWNSSTVSNALLLRVNLCKNSRSCYMTDFMCIKQYFNPLTDRVVNWLHFAIQV